MTTAILTGPAISRGSHMSRGSAPGHPPHARGMRVDATIGAGALIGQGPGADRATHPTAETTGSTRDLT